MNKPKFSLLLTLLLSSILLAQATEEFWPQHLQKIESLQRHADKLAFGELGSNNYHLAKARSWLDLALSEYHEKDSGGIVLAAVTQAETLLDALDKKQADITMDTPTQLPGSETVRPDLWDKIETLKGNEKFSCGQRQIAEAEVHLVWTGHEKAESGWSHAQSYARNAEDLINEAQVAIDNCSKQMDTRTATVAAPPAISAVTAAPATVVVEKYALSTDSLFAFGSSEIVSDETTWLDKLAGTIKGLSAVEEITLVGHSDRLRSDDHQERNQLLSEQRAERIKQYLISKGIAANKMRASGAGSTQPLVQCPTNISKEEQVICLQPNRRVEITLRGMR